MTEEELVAREHVRAFLKEELSTVDRAERDAAHEAFDHYFVIGPRIGLNENPIDLIEEVAAAAEYSAGSYDAAKKIAADLLKKGKPLPGRLSGFVARVLEGETERPQPEKKVRRDTDLRNEILAYAVWLLERAGIPPTKATESDKECGCDIVADIYDSLLAHDTEGVILKPKGGEFSRARMRDIWLKDEEILEWRKWQSTLPDCLL
ncbi:MAG TPA: hypothetical protein DHU56_08240 [Marinobacter sp.]|nr:hypothetical protein [Marinobacter sp.]